MANISYLSTLATTNLDGNTGMLVSVNVTAAGDAAATVTVYDNTAASGTILAVIDGSKVGSYFFTGNYYTGLTVVVAGTTAPKVSVVWGQALNN